MRALSLTQEQRGYYHATASLIYPVCYVARIPSTVFLLAGVQIAEYLFRLNYPKIFIEHIFEMIRYASFN